MQTWRLKYCPIDKHKTIFRPSNFKSVPYKYKRMSYNLQTEALQFRNRDQQFLKHKFIIFKHMLFNLQTRTYQFTTTDL